MIPPLQDPALLRCQHAMVAIGALPPLLLQVPDCRAAHMQRCERGAEVQAEAERTLRQQRGRINQ